MEKKIVISAFALRDCPAPKDLGLVDLTYMLSAMLYEEQTLRQAPFHMINLILRIGFQNDDTPLYASINEDYGDLPVTIEVKMEDFLAAAKESARKLHYFCALAAVKAIIHICETYQLPNQPFKEEKQTLENILQQL